MTNSDTDGMAESPRRDASGDSRGHARPSLRPWQHFLFVLSWVLLVLSLAAAAALCISAFGATSFLPECRCWAYLPLAVFLGSLYVIRFYRYRFILHSARLEDRSEIQALIIDGRNPLAPPSTPGRSDELKEKIMGEATRLETIGPDNWTEFQVLALDQLLVDFAGADEVIAKAISVLDDWEEYAKDDSYPDFEDYYQRKKKEIEEGIKAIPPPSADSNAVKQRDEMASSLRARVKMLKEDLATTNKNFKAGTAFSENLVVVGVLTVLVLIAVGLLPSFYPSAGGALGLFEWGFLGISGSLTAVLLKLHQSDVVVIGDQQGRGEFRRAIVGGLLGFVAGILLYSFVAAKLIGEGVLVPDVDSGSFQNIAKSTLLAFTGGFLFEGVFERLKLPGWKRKNGAHSDVASAAG